ncbi:phosphoribosyltransferase [Aliidongia dinghuensis]|uniref:Phosphoribosyltransferase n=1 Tax=Aliidongia dinghuensis TaxID=1867774 RepID=A0A8J2YVC9_9PROT|nr:phosphoribosyltransferase [Aliidongia dinghuensis]GGF20125.1 phosphoribosyltransferase [Aliidongia dinghuensis]
MAFDEPLFEDRRDAGRQLARSLSHLKALSHLKSPDQQNTPGEAPAVLALPRGGVPVAYEIAAALDGVLGLVLVRKIGAPGNRELALGAVVGGPHPHLVLNEKLVQLLEPPAEFIAGSKERALEEIERRRRLYLGDAPALETAGRLVILVDDGIATGATAKAALAGIAQSQPARLVLAVPVAPPSTTRELRDLCDELVCLATPEPFYAVGHFYRNFDQVSDDEVLQLLDRARRHFPDGPDATPPDGGRQGSAS